MNYFFSHARTALKYGILNYQITDNSSILIPEYICDVIMQPISQCKLHYDFYKINDDFTPDWNNLEKKINKNTKFILMVHYFGKNQDFNKFRHIANKNNIILIEDNAHGYGGCVDNNYLGELGDISISSPRKIFNINNGGILNINKDLSHKLKDIEIHSNFNQLSKIKFLKNIIRKYPYFKNFIKNFFLNRYKYEDPNSFREEFIKDYLLDTKTITMLNNFNISEIKKKRIKQYNYWYEFCIKNNLKPAFQSFDENLMPWCFPAYTNSHFESQDWFDWGWKNNKPVFSWPTLPIELIDENNTSFKRWKKLICFSII